MGDRFESWQRPEWRAVRKDGTWTSEPADRSSALRAAWAHHDEQPGAPASLLGQRSRPPEGYHVTNGAEVFEHRRVDR